MAQPSVACFFNTRKRTAIEDSKINRARKVLVLDSHSINKKTKDGLEELQGVVVRQNQMGKDDGFYNIKQINTFQTEEDTKVFTSKIISSANVIEKNAPRKTVRSSKTKKEKTVSGQNIQTFLNNMGKKNVITNQQEDLTTIIPENVEKEKHITPPSTPTKKSNAMDKLLEKPQGPSIKELKKKMTRSGRLADLKASIDRFKEGANKLKEVEKKTSQIPESPKLKNFKTIELEVHSPQKLLSPQKAYLSPKKDSTVRKNLLNLLSPTKNAVSIPASPSKKILDETSKPALTLPYKYRYLAEIFRTIDTVCQILFNRRETITFKKLKPAVEEMLKRNLMEKHIAQIKHIYPDAFTFKQEKLRVFGAGMKQERWELVITPDIVGDIMSSEVLLERRRKLFAILLDKVKDYHDEFLQSLDPPMTISKNKITRWHPEFDIEKVPDIERADIPQPPTEEKFTSGKDVLEKAKEMYNCNTRMEQALLKLKAAQQTKEAPVEEKSAVIPENSSVLKGIPKALLEKVRQKQAAKALVSMTRSVDKEKEVQLYSRLPELARLTRNLFVSEKKSVLPLDVVVEKLGNCYRAHLTKTEMEEHLKVISKEVTGWLVFHEIRHTVYIKLSKNADLSIVLNKLENLAKQKSEA